MSAYGLDRPYRDPVSYEPTGAPRYHRHHRRTTNSRSSSSSPDAANRQSSAVPPRHRGSDRRAETATEEVSSSPPESLAQNPHDPVPRKTVQLKEAEKGEIELLEKTLREVEDQLADRRVGETKRVELLEQRNHLEGELDDAVEDAEYLQGEIKDLPEKINELDAPYDKFRRACPALARTFRQLELNEAPHRRSKDAEAYLRSEAQRLKDQVPAFADLSLDDMYEDFCAQRKKLAVLREKQERRLFQRAQLVGGSQAVARQVHHFDPHSGSDSGGDDFWDSDTDRHYGLQNVWNRFSDFAGIRHKPAVFSADQMPPRRGILKRTASPLSASDSVGSVGRR
ncbi:hypothetical protein JCM10908_002423 [Rhodotorula pacifica]|uniref:uncharacterized protein n=1 Tax=Rhodotorula pacifica TaxID=1495444 RepID=UPI003172E024